MSPEHIQIHIILLYQEFLLCDANLRSCTFSVCSLLREEVSVGAAVLHGYAVALATHTAACHRDGTLVVRQGSVFHHRHVPQEGIRSLLGLHHTNRQQWRRLSFGSLIGCISVATFSLCYLMEFFDTVHFSYADGFNR